MKPLVQVTLVQYYLHEAVDIKINGNTAFLGPNGSGKSSTLDAIQIALLGGNLDYFKANSQSVSSKQRRSIASYCLGMLRNPENDSHIEGRAREEARTYIILVFSDGTTLGTLSVGICIETDSESEKAEQLSKKQEIKGLFVLPGITLCAADCLIVEGNDRIPMPFPEFRDMVKERCKLAGRTATITKMTNEYVRELLYAMSGHAMLDTKRFMQAFVKSMTLKNVDSIDQFVRDFVVEPNPVDVTHFRRQVEQFNELRTLILRTKARLGELTSINESFKRARGHESKIACLKAMQAIFETEHLGEELDRCESDISSLQESSKTADEKAAAAKEHRDQAAAEATSLEVRMKSNEGMQYQEILLLKLQLVQKDLQATLSPIKRRAHNLVAAIRAVRAESLLGPIEVGLRTLGNEIESGLSGTDDGDALSSLVSTHHSKMTAFHQVVADAITQLADTLRETEEEQERVRRRIAAVGKTGRLLNDGASLLLEKLNQHHIEAKPISALASISDRAWAPALEAYLGGDRDALVVLEGETQPAVRILRELRRTGYPMEGAAIVQPHHLRDVDMRSKGPEFAISLVQCEHTIAERFLTMKLGSMRIVETESQLEQYSRAITQDGMLSQGGLTKSIRVTPVSDLKLGLDFHDTAHLSRHATELAAHCTDLKARLTRITEVARWLDPNSIEGPSTDQTQLDSLKTQQQRLQRELAGLDLTEYNDLKAAHAAVSASVSELDAEYVKLSSLRDGLILQSQQQLDKKIELTQKLQLSRAAEQHAKQNNLVDMGWLDSEKDALERLCADYGARLREVASRVESQQTRLDNARTNGSMALAGYIESNRLDVQVQAMSWHEMHEWSTNEYRNLTDTHLHHYEAEAERARAAAEETLRNDIAMSLHDRIQDMERERRERNKMLEACPPFTGGERYRFTCTPVAQYEPLVRYINQIATTDQKFSLFADSNDEINAVLRNLVEGAAETGNASGILDYRQFFTFDLDILVEGKRVDRMSSRQGAGSNGEHIAPMYVAAGAALAKAYRLDKRKNQNDVGLVCLDEAFHGMDTTNAVATARFLQSIGLQMIMAGPELERTKLSPITQTIYDLDREGLDLQMLPTFFKPAANALMVSDMPSENPRVMQDALVQLGFDVPASVGATP